MRWLAESEVVNEQYDLVVSMKDCWEASNANPVNRRNEMMVRARGFSDYAKELGHVGVFFTWTAPSRFHAWAQKHNGKAVENKRYQGATPRETCAYLAKLWSRARAALKRWNAPRLWISRLRGPPRRYPALAPAAIYAAGRSQQGDRDPATLCPDR